MSQFDELKYKLITDRIAAIGVTLDSPKTDSKAVERELNLLSIQWNEHIISDGRDIKDIPAGGFKDGKIFNKEAFIEFCEVHLEVRQGAVVAAMDKTFADELKLEKSSCPIDERIGRLNRILEARDDVMLQYRALGYNPIERRISYESKLPVDRIKDLVWGWDNRALEPFVDITSNSIFYSKNIEKDLMSFIEYMDNEIVVRSVEQTAEMIPGHKNTSDYLHNQKMKAEMRAEMSKGNDIR